jgi:hypothetical protein
LNEDGIEISNKDETTIKIKDNLIEIKNKANSTITVNADDILLNESSVKTKLGTGLLRLWWSLWR